MQLYIQNISCMNVQRCLHKTSCMLTYGGNIKCIWPNWEKHYAQYVVSHANVWQLTMQLIRLPDAGRSLTQNGMVWVSTYRRIIFVIHLADISKQWIKLIQHIQVSATSWEKSHRMSLTFECFIFILLIFWWLRSFLCNWPHVNVTITLILRIS